MRRVGVALQACPGPLHFALVLVLLRMFEDGFAGFPRFAVWRSGSEPGADLIQDPDYASTDTKRLRQLPRCIESSYGSYATRQQPSESLRIDDKGLQPTAFACRIERANGKDFSHVRLPSL